MANRKYNFTVREVIGHWQYLGELPKPNKSGARMLILKCLGCGKIYHVQLSNLTHSKTKMCHACAIKHIFTKHNLSSNKLYTVFKDMHKRCEYEKDYKYPNYGGRGIKVCEEWQEYEPFSEWAKNNGYTDELTLDRIDNNGDYSPNNCRWATYKEQALNTRTNHFIEFCGEIKTLSQWADELGINRSTLCERINSRGWSIEKALTTPAGKGGC